MVESGVWWRGPVHARRMKGREKKKGRTNVCGAKNVRRMRGREGGGGGGTNNCSRKST